MKKKIPNENDIQLKHKAFYFLITLLITILITRGLVKLHDPNIFIKSFELHHFYFGLTILIVTQLAMLFGRVHPKIYLFSSAISIGLIIDETLFIMGKVRGSVEYSTTFLSSNIFALIVIILIAIISYDIIGHIKGER